MIRAINIIVGAVVLSGIVTANSSAPSTQPAPDQTVILILPFSAPAGPGEQWIGKAVQQDLFTELTRGTLARVTAPAAAPPAADVEAARTAAQHDGASIVIFGQVQVAGRQLRFTGEIFDVAAARPMANLKATGPMENLFHLEDALAGQCLAAMPRNLLSPAALAAERRYPPAAQPGDSSATAPSAGADQPLSYPTYVYPSTTYTYYEPYAVYEPYIPMSTYSYPFFSPFFFDFDFDRSRHFHHHDFDRRFDGGFTGRNFGTVNQNPVNHQSLNVPSNNSMWRTDAATSTMRPSDLRSTTIRPQFSSPPFSQPGMIRTAGSTPAAGGHGRR